MIAVMFAVGFYSVFVNWFWQLNVRTKSPEVTISVIQELIRRQALKSSLAGRDEKSVCTILKFLMKYVQFVSSVLYYHVSSCVIYLYIVW